MDLSLLALASALVAAAVSLGLSVRTSTSAVPVKVQRKAEAASQAAREAAQKVEELRMAYTQLREDCNGYLEAVQRTMDQVETKRKVIAASESRKKRETADPNGPGGEGLMHADRATLRRHVYGARGGGQ